MPVKVMTTGFGQSMPPVGPHNVSVDFQDWESLMAFRRGDKAVASRLENIYLRFTAWGPAKQLATAVGQKLLKLPAGYACLLFVSPDMVSFARNYALSPARPDEARLVGSELLFRAIDVAGVRLYVMAFPEAKKPGVAGVWQNPGVGVSSRLAEDLLPHAEKDATVLEWAADGGSGEMSDEEWWTETIQPKLPPPTYLPDTTAHQQLRERIVELMRRAPREPVPTGKQVRPHDVFLYPTGMAAIYRLHLALMEYRRDRVVALGSLFHNTWYLFKESPLPAHEFRHFGRCAAESGVMDTLDAYCQAEAEKGAKISYVFVEFPSNPILISVDLFRLKQLADKWDFVLVVDETVASFSNVDVFGVADVVLSSLTKSFSGYANVMGGSVVLSPTSPRYDRLRQILTSRHRNELFAGDAAQLLSNNADYLARTAVLNCNAAALATFLQGEAADPSSAVTGVLYPPCLDSDVHYRAVMRPATPALTPGYGCLLSIDFATRRQARVFVDNLPAYHGPHLGAHHMLVLPFNEAIWGGKDQALYAYNQSYGMGPAQVRISVGLESEEDTLDTVKHALAKVAEAKAKTSAETEGEGAVKEEDEGWLVEHSPELIKQRLGLK